MTTSNGDAASVKETPSTGKQCRGSSSSDKVREAKLNWFLKLNPKNNSDHAESMKMKGTLLLPTANGEIPPADDLKLSTKPPKSKPASLFDFKFILLLLAFVICLSGTVVTWFTDIYSKEVFKRLTLANGTALHRSWRRPPLEPLLCVHIFNYTNADVYWEEKGVELKVEDVGPYCYRETIERLNITFNSNGTLIYNEKRTHVFDPEASGGMEDDIVMIPNIPVISAFALTANLNRFLRFGVNTLLSSMKQRPFLAKNVTEFLFGYSDSIVDSFKNIASITGRPVPYDKFGILVKRAGLSKDRMTISTGEADLDQMGQVTNINGISMFSTWGDDECNRVRGSDGLFYRRSQIKSHSGVELFHKDSCRTLPLEFGSEVTVGSGIMANRYKLRKDVFKNNKAENKCYCVTDVCELGDGFMDVSKCSGAPMLISRPHFLYANVSEEHTIKGLKPNKEQHEFHIDVFPPIGLVVRTMMRMQMNVMVRNPHQATNLGPLPDKFILPVVWVEMNSGEVPKKMFSLLYHLTYTMKWVEIGLMWGFIVLTVILGILIMRYSVNRTSAGNKEIIIISKKQSLTTNTYVPPSA